MALKGTFYGTTSNDKIEPKILWSATQSVAGNYSTVKATLYYSRTNTGYTTKGTGSFSLTINGKKATASKYVTITYNSNTEAITHTVQVAHDADGTKNVTISATGSIPDTTLTSTTISAEVTLNAISRATTPTLSASSAYIGDEVTITLPRTSGSFTHDLEYKFSGTSWIDIKNGVGTSYTWTLPDLSGNIPNALSGVLSIRCTTKSGDTTIGSKTVSLTLKVPDTATYKPKINSVTVSEAVDSIKTNFSVFIQNKSKIKVEISASGQKGSTIKSYSTTFLGSTYTGSSWTTSGAISKSGTLDLVTTVTDSRGRTAKKTTTITVQPYFKPKVSYFDVIRVNKSNKIDHEGTYVRAVAYGETPSYCTSMDKITFTVKLEYKESVSATATWQTLSTFDASDAPDFIIGSTGGYTLIYFDSAKTFTTDKQYDLRITATDFFGASSSVTAVLPTGVVIADIKANGKGIAIGKVAELDDTLDVGWKTLLRGGASKTMNLLWDASVSTSTNGWYMYYNEEEEGGTTQTVNLNQNISDQLTGVVFAWSAYDSTTKKGTNKDWHFFFVPKTHNFGQGTNGVWMCDAYLGLRKYVYIYDNQVIGHYNNKAATTTNGIAFDNTKYVLRYIAGV